MLLKKIDSIKGMSDYAQRSAALARRSKLSPNVLVVFESDLRAHMSPSRQLNMSTVAKLLAQREAILCPNCSAPGLGGVGYEKGLTCSKCGDENESPAARTTWIREMRLCSVGSRSCEKR